MINRNSMTGLVACVISSFCTVPALAQSNPYAVQNYLQQQAQTQPYAQTYTPNINGVPIDPNVPTSGLNAYGQPDGSSIGNGYSGNGYSNGNAYGNRYRGHHNWGY